MYLHAYTPLPSHPHTDHHLLRHTRLWMKKVYGGWVLDNPFSPPFFDDTTSSNVTNDPRSQLATILLFPHALTKAGGASKTSPRTILLQSRPRALELNITMNPDHQPRTTNPPHTNGCTLTPSIANIVQYLITTVSVWGNLAYVLKRKSC